MIARVWRAVIHIDGAGVSTPAWRALALVSLTRLRAAPSVGAGVGQTGMFSPLTVASRVALSAGALVFVRPCVDARPSIQTGLVSATVVQIFITKVAAPVGVTEALPGLHTGAMNAAGVRDALVTVLALPAIQTLAATRFFTGPMLSAAALSTDSCCTIAPGPAFQTRLVPVAVARIMSKKLISRATKFIATESVIMLVAADTDLVLELRDGPVVSQLLPVRTWVDHS